jgi:hypothetical protein
MGWVQSLWDNTIWPSLVGNGPEDFISFLIIGGLLTWGIKAIKREWNQHKAAVHAKLDHIIVHHPDIPNEVPGLGRIDEPSTTPVRSESPAVGGTTADPSAGGGAAPTG